jgi:hypothetical protein
MKLIEFEQGDGLNAEVFTRNEQRISNLRRYEGTMEGLTVLYYLGEVNGETQIWLSNGENVKNVQMDLMCKVESEPKYTYQIKLKDFISSEFDTLADLHHYISKEVIKQGQLIINKK